MRAREQFIVITQYHVGEKMIQAFGQTWFVNGCIGPEDVGKKLYQKSPQTLAIKA